MLNRLVSKELEKSIQEEFKWMVLHETASQERRLVTKKKKACQKVTEYKHRIKSRKTIEKSLKVLSEYLQDKNQAAFVKTLRNKVLKGLQEDVKVKPALTVKGKILSPFNCFLLVTYVVLRSETKLIDATIFKWIAEFLQSQKCEVNQSLYYEGGNIKSLLTKHLLDPKNKIKAQSVLLLRKLEFSPILPHIYSIQNEDALMALVRSSLTEGSIYYPA